MLRLRAILLIGSLCWLNSVSELGAQGLTGQISGSVVDPTGRAVAGTTVVLVNIDTAQTREATTGASGDFVIAQLLRGTYRLTVSAPGFKRFERPAVELTATERVVLPEIVLELGEVTQTVTVQTQNIPLKGRDYLGLLKVLPGVVDTQNRNAPGWNNLSSVSINGGRTGTLNLTLDGVSSLDTGSMTGPYLAPSIDAVAEIKVLLTNYQAEYGRSSGGTINTVIKSGTRDFQGRRLLLFTAMKR
jgi:hypothetical protein